MFYGGWVYDEDFIGTYTGSAGECVNFTNGSTGAKHFCKD